MSDTSNNNKNGNIPAITSATIAEAGDIVSSSDNTTTMALGEDGEHMPYIDGPVFKDPMPYIPSGKTLGRPYGGLDTDETVPEIIVNNTDSDKPDITTKATGEEGDIDVTTMAGGEEGDLDEPPLATTMALGEEGDIDVTTMAGGEEGDLGDILLPEPNPILGNDPWLPIDNGDICIGFPVDLICVFPPAIEICVLPPPEVITCTLPPPPEVITCSLPPPIEIVCSLPPLDTPLYAVDSDIMSMAFDNNSAKVLANSAIQIDDVLDMPLSNNEVDMLLTAVSESTDTLNVVSRQTDHQTPLTGNSLDMLSDVVDMAGLIPQDII